jgi:RsiW-degrading membrane proteinase PrsW (M82 family)
MLQRIQTLYLLAIVILSGITFFMPAADLINQTNSLHYVIDFKGVYLLQTKGSIFDSSAWGFTAIAGIIPFISLYSIFQYKNRIKQIRFSVLNIFFMIGFYIILFIYLWLVGQRLNADWTIRYTTSFPLICLILNYLAIGAIGKDEKLVKSLNRVR